MSMERLDQELSLGQLKAISAGIRVGFVVGPISTQGNAKRPWWVRSSGLDVGPISTPRRRFI